MKTACLTGGIATGKSAFLQLFIADREDIVSFDCDAAVHRLLAVREVAGRLVEAFGPQVADAEGAIDRAALREIVFADARVRGRLESLLHPEVLRECLGARDRAADLAHVRLFVAEVPLLYESEFDVARDYEIVVASSPDQQRARLRERRGLRPEMADRILAAQWPILRKVERTDIVIWNGGNLSCLKRQAHFLRSRLDLPGS